MVNKLPSDLVLDIKNRLKTISGQVNGIIEINTSYKSGTSEIKFDKSKTSNDKIKEAIESKGYLIKK